MYRLEDWSEFLAGWWSFIDFIVLLDFDALCHAMPRHFFIGGLSWQDTASMSVIWQPGHWDLWDHDKDRKTLVEPCGNSYILVPWRNNHPWTPRKQWIGSWKLRVSGSGKRMCLATCRQVHLIRWWKSRPQIQHDTTTLSNCLWTEMPDESDHFDGLVGTSTANHEIHYHQSSRFPVDFIAHDFPWLSP